MGNSICFRGNSSCCACCWGRYNGDVQLTGKIAIITGSNTGIGRETALDFVRRGAVVIMACRNVEKGESAAEYVRVETGDEGNVHVRRLDLSSLSSVREFAEKFLEDFDALHILVNNAGVMVCPYGLTEDGFEQQMGVNHYGHFALTNLLLPRMKDSGGGRVVNVSSSAHKPERFVIDDLNWEKRTYSPIYAYCQSKLANVLFTKELNRKLDGTGITTYTLHPGAVKTDLQRHHSFLNCCCSCMGCCAKTPTEGAQTSIYCALEEGLEVQSGEYFVDCKKTNSNRTSHDEGLASRLWAISEEKNWSKVSFLVGVAHVAVSW